MSDLLEIVARLVDAMNRSDPVYVRAHGCRPCGDDEWETAIQAGEDAIEEHDPTPWCHVCGAKREADCHCGPLADNE